MKKTLLLTGILTIANLAMAASIHSEDSKTRKSKTTTEPKAVQQKQIKLARCCATASSNASASGTDCYNLPYNISYTATETRCDESGDCVAAYRAARNAAAFSAAMEVWIASVLIESDCPTPPQP